LIIARLSAYESELFADFVEPNLMTAVNLQNLTAINLHFYFAVDKVKGAREASSTSGTQRKELARGFAPLTPIYR
jgi:hypothetical protein